MWYFVAVIIGFALGYFVRSKFSIVRSEMSEDDKKARKARADFYRKIYGLDPR